MQKQKYRKRPRLQHGTERDLSDNLACYVNTQRSNTMIQDDHFVQHTRFPDFSSRAGL